MPFLPVNQSDLKERDWDYLDIILISGDAYIDHPSFAAAIIGRTLEAAGFRVGIIPQPDWRNDSSFTVLGKPRLFFGITAGNMDSMVNHYTAQRKLRNDDAYSPDGISGKRPDRAIIIYTNIIKRLFKGVPIVIGGIESSLRRIAHYDFWQDKVRNSILADSKADILIYGMGERPVTELAILLQKGIPVSSIQNLPSTVVFSSTFPAKEDIILPEAEKCSAKETFYQMTRQFEDNYRTKTIFQKTAGRWLKHNPPAKPLTTKEMDSIYALSFKYQPHPVYAGHKIPAYEQIKDSITSHRGCYGGCNFCAIACHQGRNIQSRSETSLLKEAQKHTGTITDVGGPTANMYASFCRLDFPETCKRSSCLVPDICPNLQINHSVQLKILAKIGNLPRIKHLFIASGIRYDMAVNDDNYIEALATKYTGGRLKLAPEHSVSSVLRLMNKPQIEVFEKFCKKFYFYTNKAGLKSKIIPYLIIGHPGTTMEDAFELRNWLRKNKLKVEQVQEFTPTPMTISTCMYYTGLDYETGKPIHIPKPSEIRRQKELIINR
ncbi:MAG TPA: YgiQ family radical SAM protein [Candidatus Cloacimonas acidaminovorans]|nr:YgiQ family radical SAM protein [Candidatus Cloacimonas acidaminovorans]HRS60786.1 YgiQ family radical SAM protein [Candidatus Cloacimonas sp.]HOM79792.1 YgiQ family radical SAM protein [Candidatus Cloacimonas acidaminovorans]HOS07951.1 YgiQ family radical SAM protein [Candidatus Cloacimonas acidaminovorans]HOT38886.1 YgiQ family radical SAM protein [Candidatus Cloacimonas acidaminovorans]